MSSTAEPIMHSTASPELKCDDIPLNSSCVSPRSAGEDEKSTLSLLPEQVVSKSVKNRMEQIHSTLKAMAYVSESCRKHCAHVACLLLRCATRDVDAGVLDEH